MRARLIPILGPILGILTLLAACAEASRSSNMAVAMYPDTTGQRGALSDSVAVGDVTGGRGTNVFQMPQIGNEPLGEAVQKSLASAGWLAPDPAQARYVLEVDLAEVDRPVISVNSVVTTTLDYRLTDRATGAAVWSDRIETRQSESAATGLLPEQRQRLANEGAIRQNLTLAFERMRAAAQGWGRG